MALQSSSRRALLFLFVVVPYPFFFIGIPYTTAFTVKTFRVTCVLFSFFSLFALINKQRHRSFCRAVLFWNGVASCIVSSAWCAPLRYFAVFQVVEALFQYLSVVLLLGGRGKAWHAALTLIISSSFYLVRETRFDFEDEFQTNVHRRLEGNVTDQHQSPDLDENGEEAMHWAAVLITLVCCLVACMFAIGYITNKTFVWLRERRQRRRVHSQHADFMPDPLASVIPNPAQVESNHVAREFWDVEISKLRKYLNTKSMYELKLLAMTTRKDDKELEFTMYNEIERRCMVWKVAKSVFSGNFELSCMNLRQLHAVASGMGCAKDASFCIAETLDPRRQLFQLIAKWEAQRGVWPRAQGQNGDEFSEFLYDIFHGRTRDEGHAQGTTARQMSRTLRAQLIGQGVHGCMSPVQEEPEDEDAMEDDLDSAGDDEVSVLSAFSGSLALSLDTFATWLF